MITVTDLTKKYARHTAVDHISFEVQKGQIVGFLGPNGAGKTTTMRMLTCFLPPTCRQRHGGGLRRARAAHRSEEAHRLSARDAAALSGNERGRVSAICRQAQGPLRRRAAPSRRIRLASAAPSPTCKDKLLGKLSKGYRQRVGLAQAIIHNPDVLILDEPTSGLDPKQINETRELIKSLAGDHTIILSTHILPEVEQTCEQVIIINKGKLVATDSVQQPAESRARRRIGAGRNWRRATALLDPAKVQAAARAGLRRQPRGAQRICTTTAPSLKWKAARSASIRGDLARAIVEAGWDLNELRPAADEPRRGLPATHRAKNRSQRWPPKKPP